MTIAEASGLEAAADLLRRAHRILITAHVNPDADALGSTLGLMRGLRALDKDAVVVLSDPVPAYARFLPGSDDIRSTIPPDPFDVIVAADSADIARIGEIYTADPSRFSTVPVLNLDHHRTNPLFGTVNYVVPGASSSSELVYRLLATMGAPVDGGTATALLFGIVGDTGSFQNGATTAGSLDVAGRLVALGADNQKIAFQLFECKTFAGARLWGMVVASIELDARRRIVIAGMTQEMLKETGASVDETEGVAEYLRGVQEAAVVMLLKETPEGDIRVSMRSRPEVDVAAIATSLGGGGHRQAAGCTLPGPLAAAKAALIEAYDRLNP